MSWGFWERNVSLTEKSHFTVSNSHVRRGLESSAQFCSRPRCYFPTLISLIVSHCSFEMWFAKKKKESERDVICKSSPLLQSPSLPPIQTLCPFLAQVCCRTCLSERAFVPLFYNHILGKMFSFLFVIPVRQRRSELSVQERAEDL